MGSICPEIALCGSKNECAMTGIVFVHSSEVSEGTVLFDFVWAPSDSLDMAVRSWYIFDGKIYVKRKKIVFQNLLQTTKICCVFFHTQKKLQPF